MVSIPPVGICSLRPVFITDLPHFEVLIQLPKHGHVFSLSLFMGFHMRHMGSVQNLLDFPDSSQTLGRTSRASQVTQMGTATPTPTVWATVLCCTGVCLRTDIVSNTAQHSEATLSLLEKAPIREKRSFSQELLPCSLVFREMNPEMCFFKR